MAALAILFLAIILLFVLAMMLSRPKEEFPAATVVFPPAFSLSSPQVPSSDAPQPNSVPKPEGQFDEEEIPILLRADRVLPPDYEVELASIGNGWQLQEDAAKAYLALEAAAAKDGVALSPVSAYRSHQKQTDNYNRALQQELSAGYSQEEAESRTQAFYAIPGTSEHEAGLAIDLNSLSQSFESTETYRWLKDNCVRFGFILRYEKDTTYITGIAFEPWHYRYVGTNHAKAITDAGITLDEYVWMLEEERGITHSQSASSRG